MPPPCACIGPMTVHPELSERARRQSRNEPHAGKKIDQQQVLVFGSGISATYESRLRWSPGGQVRSIKFPLAMQPTSEFEHLSKVFLESPSFVAMTRSTRCWSVGRFFAEPLFNFPNFHLTTPLVDVQAKVRSQGSMNLRHDRHAGAAEAGIAFPLERLDVGDGLTSDTAARADRFVRRKAAAARRPSSQGSSARHS
jgi:hypothetical protein